MRNIQYDLYATIIYYTYKYVYIKYIMHIQYVLFYYTDKTNEAI